MRRLVQTITLSQVHGNFDSLIPKECLRETAAFGEAIGHLKIDHLDYIARNVHQDMALSTYKVCVTPKNKLLSLLWK